MRTFLAKDITVRVAGKTLINESRIVINENTKCALLGKNGIGKTSLITTIVEDLRDVSHIVVDQDVTVEDGETCLDFLLKSNTEGYITSKDLEALYETDTDVDFSEKEQELGEKLQVLEWDRYVSKAKKILNGLQFSNENQLTTSLSGGWRIRLALGKALLNEPSILILDEPTNHLDLEATIWLADYLQNYKKALIIISHDIDFVDSIVDKVWYIGNPHLDGVHVYHLNGASDAMFQFVAESYKKVCENRKSYENKLKAYKKRKPQPTPPEVEEFIRRNEVPIPPPPYEVRIEWEQIKPNSNPIISMRDITFSYGEKNIFSNVDFTIFGNSRKVLVGPNGAGKTTLFKLCNEELEIDRSNGSTCIIRDGRLRVGYYNQQITDNLPLEMTPIQFLQSIKSSLSMGECKAILGRLSLRKTEVGDPTMIPIGSLSGGQKARVAFAKVQIESPHLLLLDEPTNHLDMESVKALIESINEFNGAVVIITHDMHLIKNIEDVQIFVVGNGKVTEYKGDFADYYNSIVESV